MELAITQRRNKTNSDVHTCAHNSSDSTLVVDGKKRGKKSKQQQRRKKGCTMMKCNHNYILYMAIIWCFIFSFHATFAYSASINVSLGFVAPLDTELGPLNILGKELESAFKLAIFAVNKQKSNVRLRTEFLGVIKDEGKNPSDSCKKAAVQFHSDSKIVGIVGGYSSECSIALQNELKSRKSNLPQISYRSPSMKLLNKQQYPDFYRTSSNNKKEAQVIVDVIKHFRWNQAAIIHSDDEYYGKELSDEIVSKSKNSGISIKERISFSSDESRIKIEEKLQQIKASGSRINIIVAQGNDFFKIVKQIKAKRMYGEGWVWIATDGGACLYFGSDADVNITTAGFVGISPEMFTGRSFLKLIISWYETSDKATYPGQIWRSELDPTISPYVGQVFRAVSVYHAVLNDLVTEKKLSVKNTGSEIRAMVNKRLKTMKDIKNSVKSVLGNPIYFDDQTEGQPIFTVTNYINGKFKNVGIWDESKSPQLKLPAGKIVWPGGSSQTPTDKGRPGKALFQIGFVSPTNAGLGTLGDYGKELLSAFKVAIDIINKDENNKIELDGLIKDEGIDGTKSCKEIAEEMKERNLVAVVGAYRSKCSMELHDVLGTDTMRVPIITYASPSELLSNKKDYKYLFRIPPSNKYQSEIMKQIVRKFNFKQVSTLFSDEISSKEIAKDFESYMHNDIIPIVLSQEFPRNSDAVKLTEYVEKIRQSGARVIFVSALPNDITKIEQIIREKKMAGKGWIWLGSDGATTNHFSSTSDIGKTMDGMLGVNPKRGDGAQYLKLLSAWLEKDKVMYPGIVHSAEVSWSLPYTAQVYDAVNGIALALSDLISRKTITHKTSALTIRDNLYKKLKSYNTAKNGYISTLGKNSKMYFDSNQNGPMAYDIVNLVDDKWRHIAEYTSSNPIVTYIKDPLFPGGHTMPVVGAGKVIYKVAAFFPKDSRLRALSDLGKLWESALNAAVNWVNRNDSLTVGFDVTVYDTGLYTSNCSSLAQKLPGFIDIVIGAARSECTAAIYEYIKDRGLPMLTYASTSTLLSKKTKYPNLFRMCPSDKHQANALADLVEKYLWDKVGMVTAQGIYGQDMSANIKEQLINKAITVTTTQLFHRGAKRMTKQISKLKEAGSGVNIMISNPHDALQLYQEAFELGMVGKGWTWLGSDGAISTMFKRSQNLQRAMQGMVGFRPQTGSGKLFEAIYSEWLRVDHTADKQVAYVAQIFDAVVLPAITLHSLHKENVISSHMSKVEARGHLLQRLKSLQNPLNGFSSTTGKQIYFNSDQDVQAAYDLVNLNGNNWVPVGKYEDGQLDLTSSVVWPGGTVKFPPSNPPAEQKKEPAATSESGDGGGGGTSQGLIVLAVVFSIFGLLVIIFMIYIVRRVRYRHLYMQSDLNQGGVFSVLYGHTVNRPGQRSMSTMSSNGKNVNSLESAIEVTDPMMPRHL